MNANELIVAFPKTFDKTWYMKQPIGLVSSYFPSTFNPSAGHDIARPAMTSSEPQPLSKFYTIERCFRDIDVGMVGLSHHLSFFEMLAFGVVGFLRETPSAIEEVVKHMANLLFEVFCLEPAKIFVAYFNGGTIASTYVPPPVDEEIKIWQKYFKLNLVPIPGRRTFICAAIENWPAGPGFEIFYDRGSQFPETIRFIEIASINSYRYLNRSGSLQEAVNWAVGGGIGLERLSLVLQQVPTIYDIDVFQNLKRALDHRVRQEEMWLFRKSYNIVIDHLRAIVFILLEGQGVDTSPRGKILRRLVKRTAGQLMYLNLQSVSVIDAFYEALISAYEIRYPQLRHLEKPIVQALKELLIFQIRGMND